jgi:P27 family predicted phage terminase small subunit
METQPKPPAGLCDEAKRFWREVVSEFTIDDVGSRRVLQSACEAFHRMLQAQEIISKEGITCSDRFGQLKVHPAVLIERDSRAAVLQALKQLKLVVDEPVKSKQAGRQPGVALLGARRKVG